MVARALEQGVEEVVGRRIRVTDIGARAPSTDRCALLVDALGVYARPMSETDQQMKTRHTLVTAVEIVPVGLDGTGLEHGEHLLQTGK